MDEIAIDRLPNPTSQIRNEPACEQHQGPTCKRYGGKTIGAIERGVLLERGAEAPAEERDIEEAEREHRHLELECGFTTTGIASADSSTRPEAA